MKNKKSIQDLLTWIQEIVSEGSHQMTARLKEPDELMMKASDELKKAEILIAEINVLLNEEQ